jgi:3-hydroxyisobutyrate dehydrogenase-like beta-hydroxyacid dehydrogenase
VSVVGLLYPGAMGAAIGAALRGADTTVLWASSGRSPATAERARHAGLDDVGTVRKLCRRCDIVLTVCPPHAAMDVAEATRGFEGIYVDANAIAPETARAIGDLHERFVDGGIVGPPPLDPGTTRLYLSGADAERVARLFEGTNVDARPISGEPGAASAVKAAYAGWTKGSAALLLAVRALARAEGVEHTLLAEWRRSLPDAEDQSRSAARSAQAKGWRWIGEMHEIGRAMAAQDLPDGFHEAAAEIFRRISEED